MWKYDQGDLENMHFPSADFYSCIVIHFKQCKFTDEHNMHLSQYCSIVKGQTIKYYLNFM